MNLSTQELKQMLYFLQKTQLMGSEVEVFINLYQKIAAMIQEKERDNGAE